GRHLVESERKVDAHVGALANRWPAAPLTSAAEQILDAEAAEVAHEDLERVREAEAAVPRACTTLHARMSESVVGRALVGIFQNLVRLGQLLELLFGLGRARVAIGVILQCKLAVRALD